ncbi:heme-binding domain-containing protein [Chitinophagaceae bacterium 26-R-25]|nr:heme-binding domain-containing protein [Chitinophagaceae bacterium 26-R-25]
MKKKIIIAVVTVLIVIQFFRPQKNVSSVPQKNAIEQHYNVPKNVRSVLQPACYDCHSNNTEYPWYNNVQPVEWWLASHINDGKRHLNFDEFNLYPLDKKKKKLSQIKETIEKGEMPLSSYTLIHTDARLSEEQKKIILSWVDSLQTSIGSN